MKISSVFYLIKEGFRNLWSNRVMSFASMGVLVSCLLLSGGAALISNNISGYIDKLNQGNLMMVYLKDDVSTLEAVQIGDEIKSVPNVESSTLVPKDEALTQLMEDQVDDDVSLLEGLLEDNPLPDSYRVSITDLERYDSTKAQLEAIEGVEKVRGESDLPEKMVSLQNTIRTAGFWIIILLVIVSFFIIVNTIRMTMFSRRREISIMKSVGATDWFIRVPFIVEGMIIGVISGVSSTFILKYLYENISFGVEDMFLSSSVPFSDYFLTILIAFVAAGVIFGGLGGVISIGRYLKTSGGDNDGW